MFVTQHKDVRTVTGYVRRANLFKGHPALKARQKPLVPNGCFA